MNFVSTSSLHAQHRVSITTATSTVAASVTMIIIIVIILPYDTVVILLTVVQCKQIRALCMPVCNEINVTVSFAV
jgi:hypothetical protein